VVLLVVKPAAGGAYYTSFLLVVVEEGRDVERLGVLEKAAMMEEVVLHLCG
jgi:hypothetical protein